MSPVVGTCRLCLAQGVELQDSNILPAWAHKRLLGPHLPNPNPIRVKNGVAVQDATPVKEHLLCRACEQRLGVDDNYVARITAAEPGSLPELSALIGKLRWPHNDLVVAPVRLLDLDKFIRFGIGTIWKAHECSKVTNCDLGPTLPEAFRRYLLLGTPLPKIVSLTVGYIEEAYLNNFGLVLTMFTPGSKKCSGYYEHAFVIQGLRFLCNAGMRVEAGLQQHCLLHSEIKDIYVLPSFYWSGIDQHVHKAEPRPKLAAVKQSWARGGKIDT